MTRVVVTGSEGLLGRQVVAALRADGADVVQVDIAGRDHGDGFVAIDLRSADAVAALLPACDVLVHCAARPSVESGPDATVWIENVQTATNVMLRAETLGVPRLVFASSQSALGLATAPEVITPDYLPVDEDHPCRPRDGYSLSKLTGEEFAAMVARRSGMAVRCLRFPVIWNAERYRQCIANRLNRPQQGAKSLWAYVDLRDAAEAVRLAALLPGVTGYDILNITAARPFADRPVSDLIEEWFPGIGDVRAPLEPQTPLFDPVRATARLGFRARYAWTPEGVGDIGGA